MSRPERAALIEHHSAELAVVQQAELLSLNRSSLYYQPVAPSAAEVALRHRIDELYTQYPFYGSRRITAVLRQELPVNRKQVQRCMREMGLAGICPGPNTSRRALQHPIYPYLLRHVTASCPNHVWGIDITYIRLRGGWLYLVAILDWFSRYVVSWALSQTLEQTFVLEAVDQALAQAQPAICNSDQGSHFTSPQYLERLLSAQVQISMDGRGRAMDNIFTERLWRTVKYEEVYLHDYASPREARRSLSTYLDFYNQRRPHQALDYCTPAQVYFKVQTLPDRSLRERSMIA
ncbi:MAG TPA: IS3 family transposase [Anaerolineales bacterium]